MGTPKGPQGIFIQYTDTLIVQDYNNTSGAQAVLSFHDAVCIYYSKQYSEAATYC